MIRNLIGWLAFIVSVVATAGELSVATDSTWCAAPPLQLTDTTCLRGDCDYSNIRNTYIPSSSADTITIRLSFHIANLFSGACNPNYYFATGADVDSQMRITNTWFQQQGLKMRFVYDWHYTCAQGTAGSASRVTALDSLLSKVATDTLRSINIIITRLQDEFGSYFSQASMPWMRPYSKSFGIAMSDVLFYDGKYRDTEPAKFFTQPFIHELCHVLGLWHTYHGSSKELINGGQFEICGQDCYEPPIGSDSTRGTRGDLCSDTYAELPGDSCAGRSVLDSCAGVPYDYLGNNAGNMMRNAPNACLLNVTPQQKGRIRCWFQKGIENYRINKRIYVDSSWIDSALAGRPSNGSSIAPYLSIQTAIANHRAGDTIVVAPGTYLPFDSQGKALVLRSLAGPTQTRIAKGTPWSKPLLRFDDGETRSTVISGFGIEFGSADIYLTGGGGAYVLSSPTFVQCVFRENRASAPGAAVLIEGSSSAPAAPMFRECVFEHNGEYTAWMPPTGGAVACGAYAAPEFRNCTFRSNRAAVGGGGLSVLNLPGTDVIIDSCLFDGNIAPAGAAVLIAGQAAVTHCTFVNNDPTGGARPAVVTVSGSAADLMFHNDNVYYGAGIVGFDCDNAGSSIDFHCNNYSGHATGGAFYELSLYMDEDLTSTFLNPMFCDAAVGDYALQGGSPCGAVNNLCGESKGAFGIECGTTPTQVSPPDAAVSHTSQPNLVWQSIQFGNGTGSYTVQVDDESGFNSPILRTATRTQAQTTWQVSPGLAYGHVYYWRLKSSDQLPQPDGRLMVSDWSTTRSIGVYPGGGSCPFLSVLTSAGWVDENTILTESEFRADAVAVVDFYPIEHAPKLVDGNYRIRIEERQDEVSYLDELNLLLVDASPNERVEVTSDGEFFVRGQELAPFLAVDDQGQDVTSEVAAEDSVAFARYQPGWLEATYQVPEDLSGEVFAGHSVAAKLPCGNEEKRANSDSLGGPFDKSPQGQAIELRVSYRVDGGSWVELERTPPRDINTPTYSATDITLVPGSEIQMRYEWNSRWVADALPLVVASDQVPVPRQVHPVAATHSNGRDLTAVLGSADNEFAVLRKGEVLDIVLPAGKRSSSSLKTHFFIQAKGYYSPFVPGTSPTLPTDFALHPNCPNPFNPDTRVDFALPYSAQVEVAVFNVLGQRVRTLVDETKAAGEYSIVWNGLDSKGEQVASGTYFLSMTAGEFQQRRKMTLLR